jgi:hypothetical protein
VLGGPYTNATDLRAAVFSPDGKKLAVAGGGSVRFWSLPECRVITNLVVGVELPATLQFSPDGRYFVTVPWGGEARLWDAAAYKEIPIFDGETDHAGGPCAGFSPDSRILAVGTTRVKLWDVRSRELLSILEGHKGSIMCLRFSPDGKTLATGSMDHSVKLWSLTTGQELATLPGHSGAVSGLAFSSDGNLLASSSEDNTIRLWRAASQAEVPRWREEASTLSPVAQQRQRPVAVERERAARARDPGAVRQWLVLMPIVLTNKDGATALLEEQVAQESQLRPRTGERVKVGQTELAWRAVQLEDYLINFNVISGTGNQWSVAYAVCYLESDRNQTNLAMRVLTDDHGKIYLNGQEIYRVINPTSFERDRDLVEGVNLKAGLNVLLFKVVNDQGAWQGSVRFTDAEGQPVKGIHVKLSP